MKCLYELAFNHCPISGCLREGLEDRSTTENCMHLLTLPFSVYRDTQFVIQYSLVIFWWVVAYMTWALTCSPRMVGSNNNIFEKIINCKASVISRIWVDGNTSYKANFEILYIFLVRWLSNWIPLQGGF